MATRHIAVFALLLTAAAPAGASEFPERLAGIVTEVDDGDTLSIQDEATGRCWEVRMSDYDSPERAHLPGERGACGRPAGDWPPQPYAAQPGHAGATAALKAMALGKRAEARCWGHGGYGRIACTVYVDGRSVNRAMIAAGWGMVFGRRDWVRDDQAKTTEAEAKAARRGIWADDNPRNPYRWRQDCWLKGRC